MTSSVFAHSRLPLDKWLWAIYFTVATDTPLSQLASTAAPQVVAESTAAAETGFEPAREGESLTES